MVLTLVFSGAALVWLLKNNSSPEESTGFESIASASSDRVDLHQQLDHAGPDPIEATSRGLHRPSIITFFPEDWEPDDEFEWGGIAYLRHHEFVDGSVLVPVSFSSNPTPLTPALNDLTFEYVVIGQRSFIADASELHDGSVAVRLRPCPGALILVKDQATGQLVSNVEAIIGQQLIEEAWTVIGEAGTQEITMRMNPAHLSQEELGAFLKNVWVRAPGYEWNRSNAPLRSGHAFEVELRRGGNLEIMLEGPIRPRATWLRIVGQTSSTVYEFRPRRAGLQLLEGLPAGDFSVLVGSRRCTPENAIAQAEASVVAGETTKLSITVQKNELSTDTYLAGSLNFISQPSTPASEITLDFRGVLDDNAQISFDAGLKSIPLSDMSRNSVAMPSYDWTIGMVPAGLYEATVRPFGYTVILRISADGIEGNQICVPPLSAARISFVDELSRVPIFVRVGRITSIEEVEGRLLDAPMALSLHGQTAESIEFETTLGLKRVTIADPHYGTVDLPVHVLNGQREYSLSVPIVRRLTVDAKGVSRAGLPREWWDRVSFMDGNQALQVRRVSYRIATSSQRGCYIAASYDIVIGGSVRIVLPQDGGYRIAGGDLVSPTDLLNAPRGRVNVALEDDK